MTSSTNHKLDLTNRFVQLALLRERRTQLSKNSATKEFNNMVETSNLKFPDFVHSCEIYSKDEGDRTKTYASRLLAQQNGKPPTMVSHIDGNEAPSLDEYLGPDIKITPQRKQHIRRRIYRWDKDRREKEKSFEAQELPFKSDDLPKFLPRRLYGRLVGVSVPNGYDVEARLNE